MSNDEDWEDISRNIKPLTIKKRVYSSSIGAKNIKAVNKNRLSYVRNSIDLHGLTEDEAYRVVKDFLEYHYTNGAKKVSIITGKGNVLRNVVPKWLASPKMAHIVSAFTHPDIKYGGEGVLQVNLKKVR